MAPRFFFPSGPPVCASELELLMQLSTAEDFGTSTAVFSAKGGICHSSAMKWLKDAQNNLIPTISLRTGTHAVFVGIRYS